jgi:hypothetical protein
MIFPCQIAWPVGPVSLSMPYSKVQRHVWFIYSNTMGYWSVGYSSKLFLRTQYMQIPKHTISYWNMQFHTTSCCFISTNNKPLTHLVQGIFHVEFKLHPTWTLRLTDPKPNVPKRNIASSPLKGQFCRKVHYFQTISLIAQDCMKMNEAEWRTSRPISTLFIRSFKNIYANDRNNEFHGVYGII